VQCLEPLVGHVGIDLGCGEIRVAQQHLHHSQIGAVIEQVGGEGVTQGVGGEQKVWRVIIRARLEGNTTSELVPPSSRVRPSR